MHSGLDLVALVGVAHGLRRCSSDNAQLFGPLDATEGECHDRSIANSRYAGDHALDVRGHDVPPGHNEKILQSIDHVEFPVAGYSPSYFDRHITEIAFFHNLIIIRKGNNDEKTNAPSALQSEIAAEQAVKA